MTEGEMSLEQVRDILRRWPARTVDNMRVHESQELADAIDAHLASQPAEQPRGEPVGHFIETSPGNWEQAASLYAGQPGVVALYRAPPKPEQAGCAHTVPVRSAPRCDAPGCNCATWMPEGCAWDGVEPEQAVGDGVLSGKYGDVLRPFLALMDRELHANAGKGDRPGWLAMDRKTALLEIFYHLAKLQKAAKDDDQERIREYGADVANMAMMLVDVCGALHVTPRPAVDTPAEVTDIISELGRMAVEGGVSMDAHDMSVMCSQLADRLTAQCQVRKDGDGEATETHLRALLRETANYLHACDDSAPVLAKVDAALASPSAWAVVPEDLLRVAMEANDMCRAAFQVAERVATQYATVYAGTNFGALHEQLKNSLDRQHQVLKQYREAMLSAAPEVSDAKN